MPDITAIYGIHVYPLNFCSGQLLFKSQNFQGFEIHSLPALTLSCPRRFTFYAWHAVALREGWSAKAGRSFHSLHSAFQHCSFCL
jgi:hypothetical protein